MAPLGWLIVLAPLIFVWALTLVDVLGRPGPSRLARLAWFSIVLLVPVAGLVAWLLARPMLDDDLEGYGGVAPAAGPTVEMARLALLHERGVIGASELAAGRARLSGDG